jgi:hypothetical protein
VQAAGSKAATRRSIRLLSSRRIGGSLEAFLQYLALEYLDFDFIGDGLTGVAVRMPGFVCS